MKTELDFSNFDQNLKTKIIGRKVIHFKSIDSTNSYAKKLVNKNIQDGTIVVSDVQTGGRGRKKRSWYSPNGGLWFSVIIYPKIVLNQAMIITMQASVSIAEAIKNMTSISTEIKWPNDIISNGKKICGILTELEAKNDCVKYSVIGIGINVNNQINDELKDIAISIKDIIGSDISITELLKEILCNLDYFYKEINEKNFEDIYKKWLQYSKIIGKNIEFSDDGKKNYGKVIKIDKNGSLIIKTKQGTICLSSGDVKYL